MKKGFTLLELMAVIIVLAIIFSITTPIVLDLIDSSRSSLKEEQIAAIEKAARLWGIRNLSVDGDTIVYDGSEINFVSISTLQDSGDLDDKDLNGFDIDSSSGVCIEYNAYQFIYHFASSSDDC